MVNYPAPLPKFSKPIADVLQSSVRSRVMLIYSDIIKECSQFYMPLMPTETAKAKISLTNIGRTVTEHYPVLAIPDRPNAWTHFNEKLSSYLRNARSRIKHKLNKTYISRPVTIAKLPNPPEIPTDLTAQKNCTEEEYAHHSAELRKEVLKKDRDEHHILELLRLTHTKRRLWIDNTPSTELRMSSILEKFPVFTMPRMLVEELRLLKGEQVDKFDGKCCHTQ
jgi:hypothetical protein